MRKLVLAICFGFLCANGLYSQERETVDLAIDPHQLRINFITPGLSYEVALQDKVSLNLDAVLGLGFSIVVSNNTRYSSVYLAPNFGLGVKGYKPGQKIG